MARKAKKKVHPMPKLGWKDQLLYWTAMLITGVGAIFFLFFPIYYRDALSDANPLALSWATGGEAVHTLWLAFWLFIVCILIGEFFYHKRVPVFGRSDIRYGPPAYPRIYPLLMKNKPQHWQSEKARKKAAFNKRLVTGILAVTFLICAALYSGSLCSRFELLNNGTVVVFDSQNQQKTHYTVSDMDEVILQPAKNGGRGSDRWYVRVKITFDDGEHCGFSVKRFADNWTESIRITQSLKDIYGPLLHIEDTENLWKVVRDNGMTAAEEELLYWLFEIEQ